MGEFAWLWRVGQFLLFVPVFLYVLVALLAYLYADKLIFQPPPASYRDNRQLIKVPSDDQTAISAVYLPNPGARYTVLYSHGNAEDLGIVMPLLQRIHAGGFSVFAYDYQGYGTSQGTPSEANAYRDAEAAYHYLTDALGVLPSHVLALGRSLGGGVAVELALRQPVGGLIIESSFVSTYRVMVRWPLFPFDKFRSLAKLPRVHCPVLVIHGTDDRLIPLWHGQALYQQAHEPKQSYWVAGAGHNDLAAVAGEHYLRALKDFVRRIDK